jgi:hypothetical protein
MPIPNPAESLGIFYFTRNRKLLSKGSTPPPSGINMLGRVSGNLLPMGYEVSTLPDSVLTFGSDLKTTACETAAASNPPQKYPNTPFKHFYD